MEYISSNSSSSINNLHSTHEPIYYMSQNQYNANNEYKVCPHMHLEVLIRIQAIQVPLQRLCKIFHSVHNLNFHQPRSQQNQQPSPSPLTKPSNNYIQDNNITAKDSPILQSPNTPSNESSSKIPSSNNPTTQFH